MFRPHGYCVFISKYIENKYTWKTTKLFVFCIKIANTRYFVNEKLNCTLKFKVSNYIEAYYSKRAKLFCFGKRITKKKILFLYFKWKVFLGEPAILLFIFFLV